jgi:molybdopterin-guanine dinucleotide biosynthesis protein A
VRAALFAGIFVGGRSSRMGGRPKGLLTAPGGRTIVDRWRALTESLGAHPVLVGAGAAYADVGIERIDDDPPGIGPLGGLIALLRRADGADALALACDMPFVSRALLARLVAGEPTAAILAPRRGDRWEPLCARYSAAVLPLASEQAATAGHSLQQLLDRAGAVALALSGDEDRELRDWDFPEDVGR